MTDHQDEVGSIAEALRKVSDSEGLGKQLQRLWERAGRPTHLAVARAAGVKSHVTVGQWLRGKTAPRDLDTLRKALDFLGTDEEENAAAEVAFDAIEDARAAPRPSPEPAPVPAPAPAPAPGLSPMPTPGLRWDRRWTLTVGVGVALLTLVLAVSQLSGQDSGGKPHAAPSAGAIEAVPNGTVGGPSATVTLPTASAPASPKPSDAPTPRTVSGSTLTATVPASVAGTPAHAAVPEQPFGQETWLVSEQSGKCADVGLAGAGGNLYQWVCADGVSNQVWRLRELMQDVYQVRNQRSGQCLTMLSNDVVQEPCSTSAEQQWNFQVNSAENGWTGGYFRNRRWGKCLDDSRASMDNGADLGPWDCAKDKLNQMFRVRPYAL